MGNRLSHTSSLKETVATDEKWLRMLQMSGAKFDSEVQRIDHIFQFYSQFQTNDQVFIKVYSNLFLFDDTESTSPRQANTGGAISNEMIFVIDYSTNAVQLSWNDTNPFHPHASMEETIKSPISTAKEDMDEEVRDADVKRRIRMRALLRGLLTITPQNLALHSAHEQPCVQRWRHVGVATGRCKLNTGTTCWLL